MCNRDNAHDVGIFPDEDITKRSQHTNQAKNQDKHRERSSNLFK